MNADSPRDPRPAQMSCGDPPRMPPHNWYRACDQSEPFDSPPVQPSIREGHLEPSAMRRVDAKLQHVDNILTQLDVALAIIYRLLPRDTDGEPMGISFDTFRTDAGPRAQIVRHGNQYDVCKRKGGGS